MNLFVPLHPGASLPLPATDRFPEAGHLWGQAEIDALMLACAARRPLLARRGWQRQEPLGLLLGRDSATAEAWRQLIADLRHTQVCPLALAPLGPEQLDASLPLPVLRWSPDARPRPVRARGEGKPQPDGLDDLLAMASAVRRLDPPLLRAMRRLVPAAPLNAGLEGALWCHADVDALTTASVRGDAREQHVSG